MEVEVPERLSEGLLRSARNDLSRDYLQTMGKTVITKSSTSI
jgi:hypothetical protein